MPPRRLACPSCGELLASVAGRPALPRERVAPTASEPEPFLEPEEPAYPPAAQSIPATGAFRPGSTFAAAVSYPAEAAARGPSRWGDTRAAASARWTNVVTDPGPVAPAGPRVASSRLLASALPLLVLERGVAIASGVIAVAFLLPWGNLMIGAAVAGDPWQTLGIVGSWHWLVWLLALPVILLASSAPSVPPWLRLGVVPITYAGLVTGLAWPYVLGPIGGEPAPIVLVFAAAALVVLGALVVRPGGIGEPSRTS